MLGSIDLKTGNLTLHLITLSEESLVECRLMVDLLLNDLRRHSLIHWRIALLLWEHLIKQLVGVLLLVLESCVNLSQRLPLKMRLLM